MLFRIRRLREAERSGCINGGFLKVVMARNGTEAGNVRQSGTEIICAFEVRLCPITRSKDK